MDMCNIYVRHVNKKADICVSLLVQVHTNSPACLMETLFPRAGLLDQKEPSRLT